ncbi:MAG: class I SAM-dependent methyltransferase [Nitrospirota bacterium]|nr:class I SAM-dependent methyltransferase [Nitrospirota bacterium]
MAEINQDFYQRLWANSKFYGPEHFNTWEVLSELSRTAPRRLEVGPGLRPRLPIQDTMFVDTSEEACRHLRNAGGHVHVGNFETFPISETPFDLICLFDIIEHIPDDQAIFSKVNRLLEDGGTLVFSVPLFAQAWTPFDTLVGHFRRYEPSDLLGLINQHELEIQRSTAYGMQPNSPLLSRVGTWFLRRHFEMAMSFHNRFLFPLGLKFQKKLKFKPGLTHDNNIDEVLVICHRRPRSEQEVASS